MYGTFMSLTPQVDCVVLGMGVTTEADSRDSTARYHGGVWRAWLLATATALFCTLRGR